MAVLLIAAAALALAASPASAQVADRGIVLYNDTSNQYIQYRTWNGTGWSTSRNFNLGSDPTYWRADFTRAISIPGTDNVLIGLQKGSGPSASTGPVSGNYSAFVWNASTNSTDFNYLQADGSQTLPFGRSRRAFDVAFESQSLRGLVVYNATDKSEPTVNTSAEYRIWTPGSGWGPTLGLPDVSLFNTGDGIRHVVLASNPAKDEVLALVSTSGNPTPSGDLDLFMWNGTGWTNFSNPIKAGHIPCTAAACNSNGNISFAAAYDSTGEKAIIAYSGSTASNVLYRIWYPWNQTLSAELTGPAISRPNQIRLAPDPASNDILLGAVSGAGNPAGDDLYFSVWGGESWGQLFNPANLLRAVNTGRRSFDTAFDGRSVGVALYGLASQTNVWQNRWYPGNDSNTSNTTLPIPTGQNAGEYLSAAGSPNASSGEILLLARDTNGDPSGWLWNPKNESWAYGLELSGTPAAFAWNGEPEAVAWTIMAQPVIELHPTSSGTDYINWSWRNPAWGFNSSQVFLDGVSVSWTGTPGNLSYYNATGLGAGTTHTLAVRATNLSGGVAVNASSTGFTAPSSGVLLYDDFEAGGGQWTTSGGTWKNATGTFQANVSGASSGTALRGDGTWADYEATFSSKTLQKGNNPWETARFLFRYSNASNYFALIPHYNSTSLEIAENYLGTWYGNRATVSFSSRQLGQDWHAYTIRVTNNTSNAARVDINVSVDGTTYINYTESSQPIANGSVGLYLDTGGSGYSSLAQWDDVRVVRVPLQNASFSNASWNQSSVSPNTPVRFNVTVQSATPVSQALLNVSYPNGSTVQRSLTNTSVCIDCSVGGGGSPETAAYDSTYKVPRCTTGGSPCAAPSSLLQCNGAQSSPGPEVNTPNTLGSNPTDSTTSGTCHSDESMENITVQTSDSTITIGESLTVYATFYTYALGTDYYLICYNNTVGSGSWSPVASGSYASVGGNQTASATFTLNGSAGNQAVRAIFEFSSAPAGCTEAGASYRDTDDVMFNVQSGGDPGTKYNWTYNETSTSAAGTYAAVNVSALNWGGWNTSTLSGVSFTVSGNPPTGTSITYAAGNNTTTSYWVGFDNGSGATWNNLTTQQAPYSAGACGTFSPAGSPWTLNESNVPPPRTSFALTGARCFRIAINASNSNGWNNQSGGVVQVDTSAPSGGSISYLDEFTTSTSASVTFTNGSDSESGVNANYLDRRQTTMGGGTCNSFGSNWTNLTTNASSPYSATGLSSGQCYQFKLLTRNWHYLNSSDTTSASVVKVDTSAPTGGSISYLDGFTSSTSTSITFANASDSESGVSANYVDRRDTAMSGGTCNSFGSNWTNLTTNVSSPYSATGLSSGQCYQFKLLTRNGALTNSSDITSASVVKVDTSAPSGTSVTYTAGYNTTGSVSISFSNGTDAESGISGNNLTSQQAALSAGSCGAYSPVAPWNTNGSNVPSPQSLSVTQGKCFRFAINVSNGAGLWNNQSGGAVQVDTTAPSGGSVTYPNGENEPDSAAVTFNNGSDSESGIANVYIYRRETARSGPGACNAFAANWSQRVANPPSSPWTDTGLTDNTCYQWSHNTTNGAGLWTNYTSSNTYINIAASGPNFFNASWNKTNANINEPVRFNVTIESTTTATQATMNVTYPNSSTIQRSLTNTSLQVGPNRFNWSYNETSTSAGGTYTAVNVSATNGTWNTSTLSGVTFTVGDATPPVISGLGAKIDNIGGNSLELHINWTTDEAANGFAILGRDPDLLAPRNWTNASLVTGHNTTLQDGPGSADDPLDDVDYGAVIYYRVRSTDASSNAAWSSIQSITPPACSGSSSPTTLYLNFPVYNSSDGMARLQDSPDRGFARSLNINTGAIDDTRYDTNPILIDNVYGRRMFYVVVGSGDPDVNGWGGSYTHCQRTAVLVEVNNTISTNGANYTAATHRNLSATTPNLLVPSILEKIPDLSVASQGSDFINLTFTSQKDPNQGVANYSLYRSPDNITYTRIANITAAPNTTLSYNDTGLAWGDKYYRLKVMVVGGRDFESESFGNITTAHVPDTSPPSGTSISYATGYNTTGSLSVSFNNGTDGESGVSGNNLTSQQAALSAGSCGAYSPVAPWNTNGSNVPSPQSLSVTQGKCFRFAINVSNGEGYWSNVSGGAVMVDTTAPTGGSLSYFNGINDTKTVVITLTNASDSESGVGTNFLDRRETAYNNGTDACNSFGENWTNLTSGIASGYMATGLETQKCYQFKMRTQNGAGTNSSDITSGSVVKVIGVTVTITNPTAGVTLGYAEVPVNVTSSQSINFIQARIGSDDWTNLTPQCAGSTTCNTSFILNQNGAYTLDVFANSTIDPIGQTVSRAFTLSVPGTPTIAVQETAREVASGAMAVSAGGQLKWNLSMNDSNVSTTNAEGGAGVLLALADAYAAMGNASTLNAVNNSSNWLLMTSAARTGTVGRWWMQFESPGAAAVRSDLPGGSLGPIYGLLRAYEINRNTSHGSAARDGLAWLLNNTSVAYNASGSAYTTGNANLSFCLTPTGAACSASAQRATSTTGAAGAIEVLIEATNASGGNAAYLNAARSAANWLISQAVAVGADQAKWPRALPPPADGLEYFTGVQEGAAGVVQAFLDLYFATGNATYLDQAVKGGKWLADRQTSDGAWLLIDQGSACSTASSPGTPCLTGYDYGAAGILDVLLSLYNATRDDATYSSSAASFKSAAQSAVTWLTQTGSGKAADDVDGSGSIAGTGELRWRYEPATDRFYTGDSEEAGGGASVVRALANAYGVLGSDAHRKAAEEGVRRLKNPQACISSDGDFVSTGSGSLRCRDRDSGSEFTSGRNGTAGVLGAMSRIERSMKATITVPSASTKNYPSSTQANIPVLVNFNASKLLTDIPVAGLQSGDVRVYQDGVLVTPINFTGNATGGDYSLNISASPAKGDHTIFVRVKNGSLKAASPDATYTVGSTHSASTSTNRSSAAPGEQFTYNVTVTGTAEVWAQVWVNTTVPSDVTLVSPASPNQSVNVSSGSALVSYVFQAVTNVDHVLSGTVANGTGQNATTATVGATVGTVGGPSITTVSNNVTGDSSISITIAPGAGILFSATSDQVGNWTWKVDGSFVQPNNSVSSASYSRNFASSGTYSVTVNVSNINGTSGTTTWTVTSVGVPGITTITNNATSDSSTDISVTAGTTVRFQATGNQSGNWTWRANTTVVKWQVGSSTSTNDTTYSSTGNFNMSVNLSNANGTSTTKVWNITVNPLPYQTPSLAIEAVQVNKSTSADCPTTPCVSATGEDFNLSVRVKNNGAAVAPNVYVNRTVLSAITWLNSSGTRPVQQTTLLPAATGDLSQWGVTGATPNYAAVDDGASDADTTYVNTTVQNNRDLYNLGDLPADAATVGNVTVIVQARKADSNPVNFNVNLRSGAQNQFEADTALGNSYANYTYAYATSPFTGSPWTVAEVNGLQAGVQHKQLEAREARVTAVWVSVNYTESDSIFVGDLAPGAAVWANWTLEFNSGPNQSYTLAVTAKDNLTTPSNSTSICLVLCSAPTLTLTPSTNRTGDMVGLNGYINVTVTVKNDHTTKTVSNANVTINPPAGLVFTANDSGGSGNWSIISSLAPGASASRNFTLRAGTYGAFSVPLQAVSPTIGSDTFSASQSVTVSGPSLSVTATPNRTSVASGQPFNVTVTVTNSGQTIATGVTSNIALASCAAGATLLSGSANRSLGNLSSGSGSNSTNYTYQLNSAGSTCTFQAYGNNTTQGGSGNTSSALTDAVASSVLSLTSTTFNLTSVAVGQVFLLEVNVTNSNPCTGCANITLTGVWTNITLPSGLQMNNGSNTSNVGSLAAGASNLSRFYLVATVAGTYSGASAIQVSTTSANGGSASGSADSVTVRGPSLQVSAVVPGTIAANTVFNYTLVLENTGAGNANNLTYNVTLPVGVSYAGGDPMNGTVKSGTSSAGILNGTYVTGGATGENVSYTLRLNITGAPGTYTLRGYGNGSNANGSVLTQVTAQSLAQGWALSGLPSSVSAGTPVQLNIRVMNGSNPVSGAVVNVTEYNGVGLFAAPTQAKSTKTTVSGTTGGTGYANLTVVPAPSTLAGYSLRVVASGSSNSSPESVLAVSTTPVSRGSSPAFSGEDYWSLFTGLPGEIAAAVSKINYLTATIASAPSYAGSQATVTLSSVSTTVNATPSTVDNRVPTTVAVRATNSTGSPRANLTVRIVETSGHGLLAGAGQSNGTAEISDVTDAGGYANLTVTPTRSPWSDWLQGKGSAPFNISVYVGDGGEEKFVMGITIASAAPASAYVQDSSALTAALAREISLLKNKMEWVVP